MVPLKIFPDDFSNNRFWNNVEVKGADDCWPWIGATNGKGYGRISFMGRYVQATRLIVFGPKVETHLVAMHNCDNPICVNPKHLSAGTYKDNSLDASAKGRLGSRS